MGVQLELGGLGAHLSVAQCQLERTDALLDRELPFLFLGGRREIDDGLGLELVLGVWRASCVPHAALRPHRALRVRVRGLQLPLECVALANGSLRRPPAAA